MFAGRKVAKLAREAGRGLAATAIQSFWRGASARNEQIYRMFAAVEIQKMWRGARAQISFCTKILAVIQIQSLVRGGQARDLLAFKNFVARKIQSVVRCMIAKRVYKKMVNEKHKSAVLKLTRKNSSKIIARAWLRKVDHENVVHNVNLLAKFVRGWLARIHVKKIRTVIKFVQSAFRGSRVRSAMSKKVSERNTASEP